MSAGHHKVARTTGSARSPHGPFRPEFWRSPLRGRWLTSILGLVLLIGIPIVAITGLLSNVSYQPYLGENNIGVGRLNFDPFGWPTHPSWLYAFTQGAHVAIGLALFPVLVAKLWSAAPRLFEWPIVRTPAHLLERLSLVLLVGSAMFEFITGIIEIQLWVPFGFYFPVAHYYGALIFIFAFAAHVALKLPTVLQGLRLRHELSENIAGLAGPAPAAIAELRPMTSPSALERPRARPLASPSPEPPTFSRRALLGTVGAGSLLLFVQGAAEAAGGPFRALGFLAPRVRMGPGPNGFPINHTAADSDLSPEDVGDGWRIEVVGRRTVSLSRAELLAMPQHTYDLPIACVEGWSTTQRWTGVRLRDLAALVGMRGRATVHSVAFTRNPGRFDQATLGTEQVSDARSLLALRVNGSDLSLDHGYPARVVAPAVPGVHCTKWIARMTFTPA